MKLVKKLNERWGVFEINGNLVILPFKNPVCPMIWWDEPCYGILLLHEFRCHYSPSDGFCHCDVFMKCSKCGWYYTFGIAIPKEIYDKIRGSKYHMKILKWELKEIYGDSLPKEVAERLKKWGYY